MKQRVIMIDFSHVRSRYGFKTDEQNSSKTGNSKRWVQLKSINVESSIMLGNGSWKLMLWSLKMESMASNEWSLKTIYHGFIVMVMCLSFILWFNHARNQQQVILGNV